MTDIEAHITGTVWKIEVEVGDTVEEGDAVVILESMKMEMPVEAEDPGVVTEILLQRGPVGLRGRHARCPRVATPTRRRAAAGRRAGAARRAADDLQPRQARGAGPRDPRRLRADAAGLDARCVIITGQGRTFSAGYDIGNLRAGRASPTRPSGSCAHPFTAAIDAARGLPLPHHRGAQRPRHRRRPGAGAVLRSAPGGPPDQARDAARQARARLLPHRDPASSSR